ncbi:ShlB/FhaC/HecB family hemolysin secretion/activation protein [Microcoleus sp. FACHB-53]|nr:ShlB/FhaC/HecB family hemolysin secretion/activation protein [Microcoleus sp. FACHB-53]
MLSKVRLFRYPSLFPLSLLVLLGSWKVEAVSAQTSNPKDVSVSILNLGTENINRSQVPQSISGNEQENLDGVNLTAERPYPSSISQAPELFSEINPPAKILTSTLGDIAQTPAPGRQLPNFPQPLPLPLPSPDSPSVPRNEVQPPSQSPIQQTPPTLLPPPEQLLEPSPSSPRSPEPSPGKVPDLIRVDRFEFEGNTAISDAELTKVTEPFTGRDISFAELFQARSAVTQLYIERGYITSGALIPPQTLQGGVVRIQVVEGGLESINVSGTRRLDPGYVRSRIALATFKPLNRERLLQALQLLQLNPLIQNLSAELAAGTQAGSSVLEVNVTEAKTFNAQILLDNNRAPSVGSFNRRVQINQANLSGAGDNLSLGYSNTDGSNGLDLSYTLPINARNGTLRFSYGTTSSNVIESPFDRLDINASSRYYELSLRQPLMQTPSEEFAVGVTASRQESETSVLEIPFPLSLGADDEGRTRISALRFFQEWTKRNSREVIAARSQFSVGLNNFSSTINETPPDSRFFSWRGQAQWVRLLAPETLLLIRGDMQIADRALVPLEQIGLGGQQTIRGYRQDVLLTDNGVLASAEVRVPVLRIPKWEVLVQLAPFVDVGKAWNREGREDPDPSFLASLGLGLQLQISDRLTARFDYGIPLVSVSSNKRTWQENGFYFSIVATPFVF